MKRRRRRRRRGRAENKKIVVMCKSMAAVLTLLPVAVFALLVPCSPYHASPCSVVFVPETSIVCSIKRRVDGVGYGGRVGSIDVKDKSISVACRSPQMHLLSSPSPHSASACASCAPPVCSPCWCRDLVRSLSQPSSAVLSKLRCQGCRHRTGEDAR